MFSKTEKDNPMSSKPRNEPERNAKPGVPSIISGNLTITGNLKTDGDVQIDGTIDGDVDTKLLTLGESGVINGAIITDIARISGAVNGSLTARVVELGRTAKITGDINHFSLAIEPGAYIQGQCTHVDEQKIAPSSNGVDKIRQPEILVADKSVAADKADGKKDAESGKNLPN